MKTKSIILFIYALMIFGGGLSGYFIAGSLASLMSGLISGVILGLCSYYIAKGKLLAYDITLGYLCLLLTFFCYRFIATQKFAPSGILFLLTTFLLIFLARVRPIHRLPK